MEPITTATIVGSLCLGAGLGIITTATGDLKIKGMVDGAGMIALIIFILAVMPTTEWGTPINETVQNVYDFTEIVAYALMSYVIGDAFSSTGYKVVTALVN
jgi:hypothetical protein